MNKINVIIPMAGLGKRFSDAGYSVPKPLLPLGLYRMIDRVISNIGATGFVFTLIVNKNQVSPDAIRDCVLFGVCDTNIIEIDFVPNGPADSCSLALPQIDLELPLIITNCDQIIEDYNAETFLKFCETNKADGVVGVFPSSSPKNSYVRLDDNNRVIEIKEKEVISNVATNGFHWWRKAKFFGESLDMMLRNSNTVNGEYYVAPSYNYMVQRGMNVMPYWFNMHYPIGTPADYEAYKKLRGL